MKKVVIFGKSFTVTTQNSDKDSLELGNNEIFITSYKTPVSSLLKEFLADLLYSQLLRTLELIKRKGRVEVFGDLDFEIVQKIDNKKQRIAKLKGNRIAVKLDAVALPKSALKYMLAHEIAHTFTKRHTERFWKIVEKIYPNFEAGQKLFVKYGKLLYSSL